MLFNSLEFIFLFLPLTLFVFFQIGGRGYKQLALTWLVAASLFFYGWWSISYLGLLLGSILFNYFIGIALSFYYKTRIVGYKYLLFLGLAVNLCLLGYFKYSNFFVSSIDDIFGMSFHLKFVVLPLAISFFTFNQIAYLVDAYRGEAKEYNFLKYCLFITFFPHLIAGPIVHHREMLPQFGSKLIFQFNPENMAVGLTIFSIGLFKKVVFADSIAVYATPVFDAAAQGVSLTFFEAWGGALAYSFQLYFDFSGYSDMAVGAARMFGIEFPLNFDSPYKAVNIIDFWRRWHMTLSRFLRDYLYIPLGGSRKGKLRRHVNLMITMLLGGLWHGAGWTFVFWGGLHGIYLIANHQWHSLQRSLGHDPGKVRWWSQALGCLITFVVVVIAWVFFRAKNIDAALRILEAMMGTNGMSFSSSLEVPVRKLILLSLIVWFTPNTQEWMGEHKPASDYNAVEADLSWSDRVWQKLRWQPTKIWSVCIGIIAVTGVLYLVRPTEFLYFQF